MVLNTVFNFVFVFFLLVLVHELGHFVVAKWSGMRVDRFQIGFGPALLRLGHWGETEFSIGPVPLGGFVAIHGMAPGDYPPEERAFYGASLFKRMATIFAGPAMSLLLGYALFVAVWSTYGMQRPSANAIIGRVVPGQVADRAGIREGDKVLSLNGMPIHAWEEFAAVVHDGAGHPLHVVLDRGGKQVAVTVTPQMAEIPDTTDPLHPKMVSFGRIFLEPQRERVRIGVVQTFEQATEFFFNNVKLMIGTLTSKFIAKSVGGVVAIGAATYDATKRGFADVLELAGMLSLSLGVINLIPLPVLDGGYLMLFTVEFLRRGKKISEAMQLRLQIAGVALLVLIFLVVTSLDISRLTSNAVP